MNLSEFAEYYIALEFYKFAIIAVIYLVYDMIRKSHDYFDDE